MWIIDGIRIFVQDDQEMAKQIIARLHPLGGGTIHHTFGYEDEVWKINGYVVGSGEVNTLKGYTQDATAHPFSTPYASGNFYVNSVLAKLGPYISQTLDTTKDCEEPVYVVDLELFLNV